ncbi:phage head closure protein [Burkholderia singularis]|uniref:phage head closure protein n=1 Tax=Burkholderia singularis TaxID=1503053 RepID=UPI000A5E5309|nr:phage head closure protein [Burkholderia singularis]
MSKKLTTLKPRVQSMVVARVATMAPGSWRAGKTSSTARLWLRLAEAARGSSREASALHVRLWADVLFVSGKEHIVSGAERSVAVASMRIRFRRDINSTMRIRCDGQLYDIVVVLPNRRKDHLDLSVKVGEKYA